MNAVGEGLARMPAGKEFVITRTLDAPRELVFKAWADAPDFVVAADRGRHFCFSLIPTELGRLFLALSFYNVLYRALKKNEI